MTSIHTETTSEGHDGKAAAVAQLSLPRLYLLRFGYAVLGVGLAVTHWPAFIQHAQPWTLTEGVVNCMLLALSALALLGIRYPLQMLPVLLFESAWKMIWLTVVALPLWTADQVDPATRSLTYDLLWVVVILVVIPWRYVFAQYVTKRGDRWRSVRGRSTAASDGVEQPTSSSSGTPSGARGR